jgi:hypothetical protein
MATVILFRCRRFALDDLAHVVVEDDLISVLAQIDAANAPTILLVGPDVSLGERESAMRAVVAQSGFFLYLRDDEEERGIRRMVRFAIRHSPNVD